VWLVLGALVCQSTRYVEEVVRSSGCAETQRASSPSLSDVRQLRDMAAERGPDYGRRLRLRSDGTETPWVLPTEFGGTSGTASLAGSLAAPSASAMPLVSVDLKGLTAFGAASAQPPTVAADTMRAPGQSQPSMPMWVLTSSGLASCSRPFGDLDGSMCTTMA
jgi:hypothetical protein